MLENPQANLYENAIENLYNFFTHLDTATVKPSCCEVSHHKLFFLQCIREMSSSLCDGSDIHPQDSSNVQYQLTDMSAMWQRLKQKAANKKYQLEKAYVLQCFTIDFRDLVRKKFQYVALHSCLGS